jgi:transposase-like protein
MLTALGGGPPEVDPVSWTPEHLCFKEPTMAKTKPPYTPEFRRQMVELVRAGRSPEELAQEFEPTAQSIRNWVGQAECDAGRRGIAGRRPAIYPDLQFPTRKIALDLD